ncbi:MAG: hypothetical protein ABSD74_07570 [Rhizomicrobium sp.]|jgi:hypothetical protein
MPTTTTMTNTDQSFSLSRIYAKGWNAAKAMTSDELLDLDAKKIAELNPYRQEDERQRWREGFAGGSIR